MGVINRAVYKDELNSLPPGSVVVLNPGGPLQDEDGTPIIGTMVVSKLNDYWIGTGTERMLDPDEIFDTAFPATLVYQP